MYATIPLYPGRWSTLGGIHGNPTSGGAALSNLTNPTISARPFQLFQHGRISALALRITTQGIAGSGAGVGPAYLGLYLPEEANPTRPGQRIAWGAFNHLAAAGTQTVPLSRPVALPSVGYVFGVLLIPAIGTGGSVPSFATRLAAEHAELYPILGNADTADTRVLPSSAGELGGVLQRIGGPASALTAGLPAYLSEMSPWNVLLAQGFPILAALGA